MLKNDFIKKIKKIFKQKVIIFKNKIFSCKLAYYYYLLIGLFESFNLLSSDIEGSKRVLILGKGASIKEINDQKIYDLIESSDYRILASSVDIENHNILKNFSYDIQTTCRVDSIESFCPVYPEKIIKNFSIKGLCINSNRKYNNGLALARYRKFFNYPNIKFFDMGIEGGFTPIADKASLYDGNGLTIVQSILKQVMATKSVKEIVLLGIDFYGTGYLDQDRKKDDKEKYFYPITVGGGICREKKGIPFLKYLADLSENIFFKERFKLFLPNEIKAYIPKEILKKLLKQKSIQFV
tara:strand:- start:576 stop:1463 length:888 start_codon:yes stop_codon:yes gene_type:complete